MEHIRSAPSECVNRLFQDAPGSIRFAAFRAQNMIDVATAAVPLATDYDATNATNLAELFVFLRAGFFVAFYEPDDLDWSGHTEAIGGGRPPPWMPLSTTGTFSMKPGNTPMS